MSRKGDWECPECHNMVFGSKFECGKCGKWKPKQPKKGDWWCGSLCGEINFASRDKCRKCGSPKPHSETLIQLKPGDWKCICEEINFGTRIQCRKCGKPREDTKQDSNDDRGICSVCLEDEKNTKLPCGHVALCKSCSEKLTECPHCRKPYVQNQVESIFLV